MKKLLFLLVGGCLLAACAGNPPAWWNPQNRYGTAETTEQADPLQPVRARKAPVESEQSTEPLADTSYEEETLVLISEETEPSASEGVTPVVEDAVLPLPSVLE